jgi:hypothetical protein
MKAGLETGHGGSHASMISKGTMLAAFKARLAQLHQHRETVAIRRTTRSEPGRKLAQSRSIRINTTSSKKLYLHIAYNVLPSLLNESMRHVHMTSCRPVLGTRNFGPAREKPRLALLSWSHHPSRHDNMQGNTHGL